MKQPIIAIDVDGVVADLHTEWLAKYNRDYGDTMKVDQITDWEIHKLVKPECGKRIYQYIDDPYIYDTVKPIPRARYSVRMLGEMGFSVIFVTTVTKNTRGRKLQWLIDHEFVQEYNANDRYIETDNKGIVKFDLLLDDKPENIEFCPGRGILFSRPWNATAAITEKRLPSVHTWDEFLRIVKITTQACSFFGWQH